jgi:hypothetical protein
VKRRRLAAAAACRLFAHGAHRSRRCSGRSSADRREGWGRSGPPPQASRRRWRAPGSRDSRADSRRCASSVPEWSKTAAACKTRRAGWRLSSAWDSATCRHP